MTVTELEGHRIHVDDEGFLTDPAEWDEQLATVLASRIGLELTDRHWQVLRFLRDDFRATGETPTTRRVQTVGGVPVKEQFALFPKKPGKKFRIRSRL